MATALVSASDRREDDSASHRRDWLQITLSSIGDGVINADRDGRVTYLNPVAEELTGWMAADAAGVELKQVFRIIDESTREPAEPPVREAVERGLTGGPGDPAFLIGRDGGERPIDNDAVAIKDDRGEVLGTVHIFRDTTDRRRAERAIDLARDYAESIVATVREPLIVLDSRLHVRSANPSFYETFRVTPAETGGRYLYDLGDGQWDIPALRTLLGEVLPRDLSFQDYEVVHDFEHIGPKTMLLNARCFPPGGQFDLILLAIEDVTDRRRAEQTLRESEERKRLEDELRRRAEQLAEADRHKDEFIAVLAHELRNPLSAISMAAEVVKVEGSEENRSWGLGVIGHQVKNLNRLIEDLLDVSRIKEGKIHLREEVIDLASVIARAVESVTALVKERDHELTVSVPREPMMVKGDPTRLEQVFGNLLTNAAKYTEQGGRIAVTAGVEGGDFVVRVRDTGVGISAEMLPGLFAMFAQVEPPGAAREVASASACPS